MNLKHKQDDITTRRLAGHIVPPNLLKVRACADSISSRDRKTRMWACDKLWKDNHTALPIFGESNSLKKCRGRTVSIHVGVCDRAFTKRYELDIVEDPYDTFRGPKGHLKMPLRSPEDAVWVWRWAQNFYKVLMYILHIQNSLRSS